MSSVGYLREFVNERLTAAAEEIFGVFKKTIVQYEEEIDRQRRLLDIVWKPEIKLHRIELPQQHVCKEEVLADQQLCNQERNTSLDQEDPEPPQIKEEEEGLCSSQEGEQFILKQETDTFMLTPIYEENDHREDQTLDFDLDETLEASVVNMSVLNSVVSEPNSDPQLLSNNSHVAESQDQKGGKHEDSGSTRHAEAKQNNQQCRSKSHTNNLHNPTMLESHCNTQTGKTSFICDTCGHDFKCKTFLQRHLKTITAKKQFSCSSCGKIFSEMGALRTHFRIHTGEKPYVCKICGKDFRQSYHLVVHMRRIHTIEKSHTCQICGKGFTDKVDLSNHMRIHTGERPYTCTTCGKDFRVKKALSSHIRRVHTVERPYLCKICGKRFVVLSDLSRHTKSHRKNDF